MVYFLSTTSIWSILRYIFPSPFLLFLPALVPQLAFQLFPLLVVQLGTESLHKALTPRVKEKRAVKREKGREKGRGKMEGERSQRRREAKRGEQAERRSEKRAENEGQIKSREEGY